MKINIHSVYSYAEPVTVQAFEDEVLVYCNHAGADVLEVDFGFANSNTCDWVDDWHDMLVCDKCDMLVCDKCNAMDRMDY